MFLQSEWTSWKRYVGIILSVDPDPAPDPAPSTTDPAPDPKPDPSPPAPDDEEVRNQAGLLSAFNKYKELGTVKELKTAMTQLDQFNRLMESIQGQGLSSIADIPKALQKMRDEEANRTKAEEEFNKRIQAEMATRETEWQQRINDAEQRAVTAETQRIETMRKVAVQQYYDVNCKPEFVAEFERWYPNVLPYIEFEEGNSLVKSIKNPDGSQLMMTGGDGKVKPAQLEDLFNAIIEGKYGPLSSAPLKPVSSAKGGGVVNPAVGTGTNGSIRIPPSFNPGTATPEQLAAIKNRNYIVQR